MTPKIPVRQTRRHKSVVTDQAQLEQILAQLDTAREARESALDDFHTRIARAKAAFDAEREAAHTRRREATIDLVVAVDAAFEAGMTHREICERIDLSHQRVIDMRRQVAEWDKSELEEEL